MQSEHDIFFTTQSLLASCMQQRISDHSCLAERAYMECSSSKTERTDQQRPWIFNPDLLKVFIHA
eukprot:5615502-Amphidinium_carterae.1